MVDAQFLGSACMAVSRSQMQQLPMLMLWSVLVLLCL